VALGETMVLPFFSRRPSVTATPSSFAGGGEVQTTRSVAVSLSFCVAVGLALRDGFFFAMAGATFFGPAFFRAARFGGMLLSRSQQEATAAVCTRAASTGCGTCAVEFETR
jgi:hypothetical protein